MKTLVLKPNANDQYAKSLKEYRTLEPPLWALALSDYYKADILDAEVLNLSIEDIIEIGKNYQRVVLLAIGSHPSAFIQQRDEIYRIKRELEIYADVITHETLPINPVSCKLNWSLLDLNKYRSCFWHAITNNNLVSPYGVTYSSFSCLFNCDFCITKRFFGSGYKERPLEDLLEDLDYFAAHGVINIKFMDELFVANIPRVKRICEAIISRGYKFNIWAYARIDIMTEEILKLIRQAGIKWLAYGIEAGNDDIRRKALKGSFTKERIKDVIQMTKDADICIIGNFMFGFEDDTFSTLQETFDLAQELNCEYINFYCVADYKKLYKKSIQYSQTSEYFKPLDTKHVEGRKVLEMRDRYFQQYFRSENYLSMMEDRFGLKTIELISKMLHSKVNRI